MIETDGIFDWETNGINNGFRYPHQIAIIDNDNEARLEIKNFRIPHYELPSPYALAATNMNWKKLKEGPSLYEKLPEILEILLDYDILWAYNSSYEISSRLITNSNPSLILSDNPHFTFYL